MNSKTSIVDEFLLKGLIGMSRATSKNRMSGHPAAAILDLQALGYSSLAHKGMAAHQQHIELWLSLPRFPQAENRYSVKSKHDPRTADYWREEITIKDGGGDEHRLKILYGAHRFADCITDVNKRRSFLDSAAYLF